MICGADAECILDWPSPATIRWLLCLWYLTTGSGQTCQLPVRARLEVWRRAPGCAGCIRSGYWSPTTSVAPRGYKSLVHVKEQTARPDACMIAHRGAKPVLAVLWCSRDRRTPVLPPLRCDESNHGCDRRLGQRCEGGLAISGPHSEPPGRLLHAAVGSPIDSSVVCSD